MVGKKNGDMSNGSTKYRDQQSSMSYQKKDTAAGGSMKNDARSQNGNAFRTDSAISGGRNQLEGRTLQRWQPDGPADIDGSLESGFMNSSGKPWDQFEENKRLFGVRTNYDENIYTTTIDRSHPNYKQRMAEAEKKANEIMNKPASNSHVAEERIKDHTGGEDGLDEEAKYSGVRRQQDFPPLTSSNSGTKYTPPARRPPTGQATVKGAPVDPAIISSQLARPDKPAAEKPKASPTPAVTKPEAATPPAASASSFTAATPTSKSSASKTPSFASRTASPNVRAEGGPTAVKDIEATILTTFKSFAKTQRSGVENMRTSKLRNDKEAKLTDLKKFADGFKLNTPVPSDLISIIAKDPAKQKEIQEKAKRNAEEAKKNPSEAVKAVAPSSAEPRPIPRPVPATHGAPPSNAPSRSNTTRNTGYSQQGGYNSQSSSSFRGDRPQSQQPMPAHQNRQPAGNLAARLRGIEAGKQSQMQAHPIPLTETRLPPTGPSNDPNFSRRSSGQSARLNPNIQEFRPSAHAATFSPSVNPSTASSPRSVATLVEQPNPPVKRSLLKRAPIPASERPSIKDKFDALEFTKSLKPPPGKNWDANGGIRPSYDTPPTWRQPADDEKPESTMHITYAKLFDMAPFPPQTLSSPNPVHAVPQVAHQHQLPFHLQQNGHNMAVRGSPRQPHTHVHGNQHGHGPNGSFNGADDHRMHQSHSQQSYQSPRLQTMPLPFQPHMGSSPQMYNPQMMPYPGAPPMQAQYRSLSQQYPQQPMGVPGMMIPSPANGFMPPQGMGGPMIFPQSFIPANGPPMMPTNGGYPSPGRGGAPPMQSQGSQPGHQQPMYGMHNPGMSPGPQYGQAVGPTMYPPQGAVPMPMRPYNGQNQFGTSPQQAHNYLPQRNNHPNGGYPKNNFQQQNGPSNNQIPPSGPQARADGEESK